MKPDIRFHGHACVQIDYRDTTLLCDPWFAGAVFNSSWALLREHFPDIKRFRKNLAIWVSHEHPDHLNFSALKLLREQIQGPIRLYYRKQSNPNVREAITKMGFDLYELESKEPTHIGEAFTITSYPQGTDSALVIKTGSTMTLNQNDCLLRRRACSEILRRHGAIDLWLFQFSLAGYYGNEDEPERLQGAHERHLDLIEEYFVLLNPCIYVPFASFIYFCKPGNAYLNSYRVSPREALNAVPPGRAQLLWFDDSLLWDHWQERNEKNLNLWNQVWPAQATSPHTYASEEEILSAANKFIAACRQSVPHWLLPSPVSIRLRETGRNLHLDVRMGRADFVGSTRSPDVEIGDDDALFFFKFPWGADTLNITANLKINSQFRWRRVAYLKHCLYVMRESTPLKKGVIALVGAFVRGIQYHLNTF